MDTQKLTPSAKLTLDALNAGPGNVHELSERTGRSRSTTDKAINELAKTGLIVKVDDGGDPADGTPARWQFAEAAAEAEISQPAPHGGDNATEPDTDTPANGTTDADPAPQAETADPATDPQLDPEPPATGDGTTPASEAPTDGGATSDGGGQPDTEEKKDGEEKKDEADPPKLCRGCQAQMPKICECCWQKTPAYCGKCRKDMPQVQRGEPGEPVILSNGLPKLRPGELEDMVEKVMREQPLPAFAGIVGWTGGRLAIHIPGRSPGAMTNAMRKFTKDGKADLIGDDPERYQLKDADQPDGDSSSDTDGQDEASQAEATQPAADATEPQPDNAA